MDDCDGESQALGVRSRPARRPRVFGHDDRVAVVRNLKRQKMRLVDQTSADSVQLWKIKQARVRDVAHLLIQVGDAMAL